MTMKRQSCSYRPCTASYKELASRGGVDPSGSGSPSQALALLSRRGGTLLGVLVAALALRHARRLALPRHRWLELSTAAVGGLLSSSCCVVQLALNSFSIGCAGFAVLDRYRPLFLILTMTSLATKTIWYDIRRHRSPWSSLPTWALAIALSSSPAVVKWLNRRGLGGEIRQGGVRYVLEFRGLKCEACAHGLKRDLEALEGVGEARVLFSNRTQVVIEGKSGSSGFESLGVKELADRKGYIVDFVGHQAKEGN